MSKLVAFIGSPRKNGDTTKLVEQVIAGAKSEGAEVVTYDLNDDGVKGCQGCYYCRANEGCATEDKLQSMYADIKEADGIVAGFPIYFGGISGQAKLFLDRLFAMVNDDFSPRYPGKKFVSIYSQGNPDKQIFKAVIDANDSIFKMLGWQVIDSILSSNGNDPQYMLSQDLMEQAYQAGQRLVK